MLRLFIFLLALMGLAGAATGQTTRPAEPWPGLVGQLAEALTAGQRSVAQELLRRAEVRRFNTTEGERPERLQARTGMSIRVSAQGYFHPALSMAADLAADLKATSVVPDEIKRRLIPEDDAQMKRANATAVQWVAEVLGAKDDEPVGVILLWCSDRSMTALAAPPELLFILVKGEQVENGRFRIVQVIYGDPLSQ